MSDWDKKRIEELLKKRQRILDPKRIASVYDVGYCPRCNDITEINYTKDYESYTYYANCGKCNLSCVVSSVHYNAPNHDRIRTTRPEIPLKLQKKFDSTLRKRGQMKLWKEKARAYMACLEKEQQELEEVKQAAERRLGKFIS